MKQSVLSLGYAMLAGAVLAAEYKPEPWVLEARQKFAEQRFGVFIHWGLYANYAQGEWYLQQAKLDESAYARMMYGFCPSKFDAKAWVKVFKDAGAKYVTITSRHHDGFSLWPTKVDDGYNIACTPFANWGGRERDILGELAEACHEAGLQLNFYYSLMDWHRKDYPAGTHAQVVLGKQKGDYASYKKFMMGQITELIDRYHPGNIWFDGEWEQYDKTVGGTFDWQFDDIFDLIHSKHVLVANNNHKQIRPKEDIQLFERDLPGENGTGFSANQPVTRERPIEQCDVIQPNIWGYKISEKGCRPAENIVEMVARAAAKDANLLMNIGPDGSGQLPAKAVASMKRVGPWFAANGESIYGTTAGGVANGRNVVSTRKGGTLYLHFLKPEVDKITFKVNGEVVSCAPLAVGTAKAEKGADGQVTVTATRPQGYYFDQVVKLVVK